MGGRKGWLSNTSSRSCLLANSLVESLLSVRQTVILMCQLPEVQFARLGALLRSRVNESPPRTTAPSQQILGLNADLVIRVLASGLGGVIDLDGRWAKAAATTGEDATPL